MRRDGLWHPRLMEIITAAGHTDTLVLADAGLPVPPQVETVDLLWSPEHPRLVPVLRAVLAELCVERVTLAAQAAPALVDELTEALGDLPRTMVAHEELKAACGQALAVVRTGERTPYANVILHAGVAF